MSHTRSAFHFSLGFLILLCLSLSSYSVADEQSSLSLSPFSAEYEIDWKSTISMGGKTVRSLKLNEAKQWDFRSEASAMFATIREQSLFQLNKGSIRPDQYNFKKSVFGKKRAAELNFDWQSMQVTNNVENKPWQMAINPGVQDKISYQLLLQSELAQGKEQFSYQVADGGHLKEYRFQVEGKDMVSAPIGEFEAIRVKRVRSEESKRETFIWFAPGLDYHIIKLQQIEKKDKSYTLLLKELKR